MRSGLVAAVAATAIAALTVASTADPPELAAPQTAVHEVRLAAAVAVAPPLGAIPLAFIRNQFQYCSVICPHAVQGAVTVPIAAAQTPLTFVGSLASTGSLLKAIGAAAASVTGPANAAATPIIENDVFRVVPKAFNNLEVAVVEFVNIASAVLQPGEFLHAVNTARVNILAALNQPLPPPAPTDTGARILPQVLAVEAIKVFSAVAFQAGEVLLLGVVQSADAAAQELAHSGDPGIALAAGAAQAAETIAAAGGIVREVVDTAVTNVRDSLADPFPPSAQTMNGTGDVAEAIADAPESEPSGTDKATTSRRDDDTTRPPRGGGTTTTAEKQRGEDDSAQKAARRDLEPAGSGASDEQPRSNAGGAGTVGRAGRKGADRNSDQSAAGSSAVSG